MSEDPYRISVRNYGYHSSYTNDILHANIPLLVTGFLRLEYKYNPIRDIIILCMSFLNYVYICNHWIIGECIETNICSWSHVGRDIRTGKIVRLKFIRNDMINHNMGIDKMLQMLKILKGINHRNVVKLYAYQLDIKYPINNINSTLLVLEHVNGGYLFDIVPNITYCQQKENVIRTLFNQIIDATEAIINGHNNQIELFHSGIEPDSFLLDTEYTVKISYDFSSEIVSSMNVNNESDQHKTKRKKNSWQAPESFLNQKCDEKALIFSTGIMLFFLLMEYIPFYCAKRADVWYRRVIKKTPKKFWKIHLCGKQDWELWDSLEIIKDLLNKIFIFDPKERINIDGIRNHEWFVCVNDDQKFDQQKLINQVCYGFKKREQKRGKVILETDKKIYISDWQKGRPRRQIDINGRINAKPFPTDYKEGMFGEFYTYFVENGIRLATSINDFYGWLGVEMYNRNGEEDSKATCFYDAERELLCCELLTKYRHKITFNV
eukprot:155223_1